MTLLRVLLKKGNTVPPPSTNVHVVQEEAKEQPAKEDGQNLDALDPDNMYGWEGYQP